MLVGGPVPLRGGRCLGGKVFDISRFVGKRPGNFMFIGMLSTTGLKGGNVCDMSSDPVREMSSLVRLRNFSFAGVLPFKAMFANKSGFS